jgi:hypothetical protein
MPHNIPHFFGLSHKVLAEVVLSGALIIWALSYLMVQIIRATSFTSKLACPQCHSTDVNLSMRTTALDRLYRLIRCVPYRCQVCSTRYFCAEGDSAVQGVPTDA